MPSSGATRPESCAVSTCFMSGKSAAQCVVGLESSSAMPSFRNFKKHGGVTSTTACLHTAEHLLSLLLDPLQVAGFDFQFLAH